MKSLMQNLVVFGLYACVSISLFVYLLNQNLLTNSQQETKRNLKEITLNKPSSTPTQDLTSLTDIKSDTLSIDQALLIEEPQSDYEEVDIVNLNAAQAFRLTDRSGTLVVNCNEFPTLYKNSSKVKIPYSCRLYGNEIKEYLNGNPHTSISIVGVSDPSETENLGKLRAEYIKSLLLAVGIENKKVITQSIRRDLAFKNNAFSGGIILLLNE